MSDVKVESGVTLTWQVDDAMADGGDNGIMHRLLYTILRVLYAAAVANGWQSAINSLGSGRHGAVLKRKSPVSTTQLVAQCPCSVWLMGVKNGPVISLI